MKKGNYGLDAPSVVIAYLSSGLVLVVLGIILAPKFHYACWGISLGVVCLIIGLHMTYGSKVGKYKLREKIIDRLSIKGDETALDVGCGRGLMLNGVAAKLTNGKAFGIDIWSARDQSGNNCDAVMENAKIEGAEGKIEVVNSDMRKMPFDSESFDIIVSSLAIHNISSKDEREKALQEIARTAKKGCRIAILDLANIEEYKDVLSSNGVTIQEVTKNQYQIFPPVKILYGIKKEGI